MSSQRAISDLAYALWQARGCPPGSSDVDWVEAERQVLGVRPPGTDATTTLDPPASAADKWTEVKEIVDRNSSPKD